MRIYTKCKLRFLRPGVSLLSAPEKPTGGTGNVQLVAGQRDFTEAFFETEVDKFQDVPDWVADEPIFKMALNDGDAIVVQAAPAVAVPAVDTAAAEKAAAEKEAAEKAAAEKAAADKAALDTAQQQKAAKTK